MDKHTFKAAAEVINVSHYGASCWCHERPCGGFRDKSELSNEHAGRPCLFFALFIIARSRRLLNVLSATRSSELRSAVRNFNCRRLSFGADGRLRGFTFAPNFTGIVVNFRPCCSEGTKRLWFRDKTVDGIVGFQASNEGIISPSTNSAESVHVCNVQ